MSSKKHVIVGVPQGSIHWPLLFIIFINDLCHIKTSSKLYLFADDATISYANSATEDIIRTLKFDLLIIAEWLRFNKLVINWSKTNAMFFNHKLKIKKDFQEDLDLIINNKPTTVKQVQSFLGLVSYNRIFIVQQQKLFNDSSPDDRANKKKVRL